MPCSTKDGPPKLFPEFNDFQVASQEQTEPPTEFLSSLDTLIEDCGIPKKRCPDESCVLFDDCNGGYRHLFRIVCKRWTCEACGPVKRAQLQAKIQEARPNRFITLTTCGHETETPRQIFDWTRRQISELGKLIRRSGREFEYLRVLEATERGYPHYHLLVRSPYLEQAELSRHWCHFTRAYIVDIRSLTKDEKAAKYVMKYLTKQNAVPFTNRRLSWTRRFFPKAQAEQKADYCPINVHRYSGSVEDYLRWEATDSEWVQINRWHYVSKEPLK